MRALTTYCAADVLAWGPCHDDSDARISAICERHGRECWDALQVLDLDEVSASDRIWVCARMAPAAVARRFAVDVAAQALRRAGVTDQRSWRALDVVLAYDERGEVDPAWVTAWAAAEAAARADQLCLLRALCLRWQDGQNVLAGEVQR